MKITSISRKLLTRVLSVYFILTISVTVIQIAAEYFNTRSHINSELLTLQKTVNGSLTRAVWELNTQQAIDISEGLIAIPMIKGITVTDENNNIIVQLGILPPIETLQLKEINKTQNINFTRDGLFGHSFPLVFEFSGRTSTVGTVTLLSSNHVIFNRIEVGIYFLIGNAIVKTTFLIFLFSLAFEKLLTDPLKELTDQINQIDLEDPETSKLHSVNYETNELNVLESAYNNLLDELIAFQEKLTTSQIETKNANEKLDEQNIILEQEVAKKTSSLSNTLLNMEIQQNLMVKQQQQLQEENDRRSKTEKTLIKTNKDLQSSISELNIAQEMLLESEKMASLGALSAEISHEVNTPIGIGITSTSYLSNIIIELQQELAQNNLSKKSINNFIEHAKESVSLLENNLKRASELILSFKQISVDQTSDKLRLINVSKHLEEIIQSLQSKLKKNNHHINIECDNSIEIYSHPGAIVQIFINLITNSITHGFDEIDNGLINIKVSFYQQQLHINYNDNGHGVTDEQLDKLFTPFYTTKTEQGGTGLGTHIIKKLVVDTLNGTININNKSHGLSYNIILPDMKTG